MQVLLRTNFAYMLPRLRYNIHYNYNYYYYIILTINFILIGLQYIILLYFVFNNINLNN